MEGELHREDTGAESAPGFAPPVVHQVLASPGRPVAAAARGRMEAGFGADFSAVRVHDDARAAESARAVDAHAYTVGSDIVFGAGRYAPGTAAGDRLLAHELAHTLQQRGAARRLQRAAFRDGCTSVGSATGNACGGTIDVRATEITLAWIAPRHLYIVFTDRTGSAVGFRGGPDHEGDGYGHIYTECGPYVEGFVDYDPDAPSEQVYEGDDACEKAQCLRDRLAEVARMNVDYDPYGANSNTVVADLLAHCGLPVRMPLATAPGFGQGLSPEGTVPIPGYRDTRHRLSVGFGGALGDLPGADVSAGYSVDLATALGALRFPLRLDTRFAPETGAFVGSALVGVELPLFDLDPSGYIPFSIGLYLGAGAGFTPDADGELDPLLGHQGRVDLGIDFEELRVNPFFQWEALQNLEQDEMLDNLILGLQVGWTL